MKKHNKFLYMLFSTILCFFVQTMVFSAINSTVKITGNAYARVDADVRITDFNLKESNGGISYYESFGKEHISTEINLSDSSGSITYNLKITNYGSSDVVIYNINGLPENVNYSIKDYNLKDRICDTSGKCNSFITRIYEITFTTSSSYSGIISLDFEFRNYYTISYTGISGEYQTSIIHGEDLKLNFIEAPKFINVYENGIELDRNSYYYNSGNIIIDNVSGNLIIEKGESFIIGGQTFSKNLKDFVNGTTDATYSSVDYVIKSINFYEDEIPSGYTRDTLEELPFIYVSEDEKIRAFNDNGNIYIYSKNDIKPNESMYSMFREMKSLVDLDLSKLETEHVYTMQSLFNGSSSLTSLDIGHFNTSKVKSFSCTFKNLPLITNLDISNFDTSNADRLDQMFMGDTGIVILDLTNFNTSKVTATYNMFDGMTNVEKIYVGDGWNMSAVTNSSGMFYDCFKLYGFNGVLDVSRAYVGFGGYLSRLGVEPDKLDILGQDVCIGEECFYIIYNDGETISMLAKYNLYVGGSYNQAQGTWSEYGSEATGIQDSTMKAFLGENIRLGTDMFSETPYWVEDGITYPKYVYNSNSKLYPYLENYRVYLEKTSTINNVRLMSYEELNFLGHSSKDGFNYVPSWVYSSSYWLGSAKSDELMYSISSYPGLSERANTYLNSYGVRPVIEMNIDEVRKLLN